MSAPARQGTASSSESGPHLHRPRCSSAHPRLPGKLLPSTAVILQLRWQQQPRLSTQDLPWVPCSQQGQFCPGSWLPLPSYDPQACGPKCKLPACRSLSVFSDPTAYCWQQSWALGADCLSLALWLYSEMKSLSCQSAGCSPHL